MKKTIFLALAMLLAAATAFAAEAESTDSIAFADSIAKAEQMNEQIIRSIVREEVGNAVQGIQNNGGNAGGFAATIFDGIENVLIPVVGIASPFIMASVAVNFLPFSSLVETKNILPPNQILLPRYAPRRSISANTPAAVTSGPAPGPFITSG